MNQQTDAGPAPDHLSRVPIDLCGMKPGIPDLDGDVFSERVLEQFRHPDPSLPVIDCMEERDGPVRYTVAEIAAHLDRNQCLVPDFEITGSVTLSGYYSAWHGPNEPPRGGIIIDDGVTIGGYRLVPRWESSLQPMPTPVRIRQEREMRERERANAASE